MKLGLEYSNDPNEFYVRVNSPSRKFDDLRTEFNNDAFLLKNTFSDMYVAFSSGVDSQVITRCFLDNNINAEYVFLNCVGYSDYELAHVRECEKFYGIRVRIINLNIDEFKEAWTKESKNENSGYFSHYIFGWLSKNLEKDYPIVTQGPNEPNIVHYNNEVSIWCNYYEAMNRRVNLMKQYRPVIDFPFSPESIASYYSDDGVQTYCKTVRYYHESNVSLPISQYYNTFGKAPVKGKYFKDDIIWYGKRTGYEQFPTWFFSAPMITETMISMPYWDLIDFMTTKVDLYRDYSDWKYGDISG